MRSHSCFPGSQHDTRVSFLLLLLAQKKRDVPPCGPLLYLVFLRDSLLMHRDGIDGVMSAALLVAVIDLLDMLACFVERLSDLSQKGVSKDRPQT